MKKILVVCLVIIMIILNGIAFDVMNNNGHAEAIESGVIDE